MDMSYSIRAPWRSITVEVPAPDQVKALLPGLVVVAACTAASYLAALLLPSLSPLIWAVFIGMAVVTVHRLPAAMIPGVRFASRSILRVGVALLGLRLVAGQLVAVGVPGLGVLGVVVPATILGTLWLGRRLGCSPALSLLVGTGSAICGASAIVAMDAVTDSDERDVTMAVATVTLFGTAAMVVLPLLDRQFLHLAPVAYGTWAGASIHEVAQVVAGAAPLGAVAVKVATVVKLTRVLMLVPLLLVVTTIRGRSGAQQGAARSLPVPLFVLGFLACVAIASFHVLPAPVLAGATKMDVALLAAALAGLGLGVDVRQIVRLGWRPLALGFGSWVIAGGAALAATLLLFR
ncbi:MAG: putative sulfate exporter family transporter [Candidatus Dormibacteraceae bacterium]